MPTREAIVDTVLPAPVEKPIPIRTISTRGPKPRIENKDQENINRDVAAPAEPEATAESVRLSPQLSALARKEQAFRQREQALKERERQIEARLAEADQYTQLKSKLSSKDYSEAEKLGLDYEGYTQYLLNKQAGEDPQAKAFEKLQQEIEDLKKKQEESGARQYEETVAEYKKEITALVSSNEDFSSIKELKREDAVLQLILDTWEEDGKELSIEQAAKDIEEHLVEYGNKFASLPKIKAKAEAQIQKALPKPVVGTKTLTNEMMPQSEAKQTYKSLQHLSEAERYAEARRRVIERRQKGI